MKSSLYLAGQTTDLDEMKKSIENLENSLRKSQSAPEVLQKRLTIEMTVMEKKLDTAVDRISSLETKNLKNRTLPRQTSIEPDQAVRIPSDNANNDTNTDTVSIIPASQFPPVHLCEVDRDEIEEMIDQIRRNKNELGRHTAMYDELKV